MCAPSNRGIANSCPDNGSQLVSGIPARALSEKEFPPAVDSPLASDLSPKRSGFSCGSKLLPLTTFIVIPIKPWRQSQYLDPFLDLNSDFQEFNRKAGVAASQLFYVLLFDLHGVTKDKIKSDLEGVDRVSILDAPMLKEIIMSESPKEKASAFIFDQLSIKERSPYTTAGAVPDNLFFGRQMELALLRGLPENVGIFGTRTIGKTSLLRRLRRTFETQEKWRVYDMDCSRINSEEELLKNLAEKMAIPSETISDMDKFRRYVTRDAFEKDCRYLFLLDEVDRLVEYDMHHEESIFNTFNRLYTEAMPNQETAARFILFGFQQMFEQMKNPRSRLYNFMVFIPLKPLDFDDAMSLVIRPMENIRVNWNSKDDARYLVERCSRHPRLLQAACNGLLSILDKKEERRDIIERFDVDKALSSDEFREICMRFYSDAAAETIEDVEKRKSFWGLSWGKEHKDEAKEQNVKNGKTGFLNDLHRITILIGVKFLFENKKEIFTITDIHDELKSYDIEVSPNALRNILDQLCLSGNFRLCDESMVIAKEGTQIPSDAQVAEKKEVELTMAQPDFYQEENETFPKFTYEFGVKIYPKLLVAHFGGLEKCEEERINLINKAEWKEWLRRY